MKPSSAIHDSAVDTLCEVFLDKGYVPIREGTLMNIESGWAEPDILLLKQINGGFVLDSVIEVVITDSYEKGRNNVLSKLMKIRDAFKGSVKIYIFEPISHVDRMLDEGRKRHYKKLFGLARLPNSYAEIEKLYQASWKQKYGLDFEWLHEEVYDE